MTCTQCTRAHQHNQHDLTPLKLPVLYESEAAMTQFKLPRTYTSTHNAEIPGRYVSIGSVYNQYLLQLPEVIQTETQVVGAWKRKHNAYEIHLEAIVSSMSNPDAAGRSKILCEGMHVVLESIAYAETAILKSHPELGRTKIFIHFKSLDPKYNRTEEWHTLRYWTSDAESSSSSSEEVVKPEIKKKKNQPKKKKAKKSEKYQGPPPPKPECKICQR